MKLLLDTHAFLWWVMDSPKLTPAAQAAIADSENDLLLSAASGWEIAIKAALGRLELPDPPGDFIPDQLRKNDIDVLPISLGHTLGVYSLPRHHADPFDRLLISQAGSERVPIITGDSVFASYEVEVLW